MSENSRKLILDLLCLDMQRSGTSALQIDIPYTAPLFSWADALMYAIHLENPTRPYRTLGPIEQNHAIMQQIPSTYRSKDENTDASCMHNRNELHP